MGILRFMDEIVAMNLKTLDALHLRLLNDTCSIFCLNLNLKPMINHYFWKMFLNEAQLIIYFSIN